MDFEFGKFSNHIKVTDLKTTSKSLFGAYEAQKQRVPNRPQIHYF